MFPGERRHDPPPPAARSRGRRSVSFADDVTVRRARRTRES